MRRVQRLPRGAIRVGALWDIKPQMTRHKRRRVLQHQVVELVAILATDLDRIAEPGRSHERCLRALALNYGVGHQRGAVHQVLDLVGCNAGAFERICEHGLNGARRVVDRGQLFSQHEHATALVDQDEVGKRAADIDANAICVGHGDYRTQNTEYRAQTCLCSVFCVLF